MVGTAWSHCCLGIVLPMSSSGESHHIFLHNLDYVLGCSSVSNDDYQMDGQTDYA